MYCMKCGKETQENQVFCERCLQVMDIYPVKPDAAIHLPHRSQPPASKKPGHRKRTLTPEEQVVLLKKANRRLFLVGFVLLLLWGLTFGALVYQLTQPKETSIPTNNKNYTYAPDPGNTD